MARGILTHLVVFIATIALEVAISASQPEYECIGSLQKLNSSEVCDGRAQCPYHDDEYYCDSITLINDCGDIQPPGQLLPCCENLPCLTEHAAGEDIPCFASNDDANNKSSEYWGECPWHVENSEALQCDRDVLHKLTCSDGCRCCPLMISCVDTGWEELHSMLKKKSRVGVRILKIENLSEASDRNWNDIADLMPYLRFLDVRGTDLTDLNRAEFAPFKNLDVLILNRNGIMNIDKDSFKGLPDLTRLVLEENNLTSLGNGPFLELPNLKQLSFLNNPITNIGQLTWEGLYNLTHLRLDNTKIKEINLSTFLFLSKLKSLYMQVTELTEIKQGTFLHTPNLQKLHLNKNELKTLSVGSFDGLKNSEYIDVSRSSLTQIETGAFRDLSSLQFLIMIAVPHLQLNKGMFEGLNNEQLIMTVSTQRTCCLLGPKENQKCVFFTPSLDFNTCGSLLSGVLEVFIWILAIAAIIGNTIVIALRCRRHNESSSQNVQRVLILNLAVSDILMGIYMLIIGAADVYYGSDYFWYSDAWRESDLCKVAGFLALMSSETSVFIITAISMDRFLSIMFPFGRKRFRGKVFKATVLLIWSISLMISLIGIVSPNEKLYGQSSVCIGLPLTARVSDTTGEYTLSHENGNKDAEFNLFNTEKEPAWIFSIVIFLCINFICLLVVLLCYITIFISIRKSRKSVNRDASVDEEIKMALKMSLIVGTNLLCWLPIVILGILIQSQLVTIPSEGYAWVIIFVLPINSSINPYLYTINGAVDYRKRYLSGRKAMQSTVTMQLSRLLSTTDSSDRTRISPVPSPSISPRMLKKSNNNSKSLGDNN